MLLFRTDFKSLKSPYKAEVGGEGSAGEEWSPGEEATGRRSLPIDAP